MITDNLFHDVIRYEHEEFPVITRKILLQSNHFGTGLPGWHEDIEIKYFTRGRACVHVGGEEIDVRAGDLLVTNPYENHYTVSLREDVEYYILVANIRLLSRVIADREGAQILLEIADGSIKFDHLAVGTSKLKEIFLLLIEEMEQSGEERRFAALAMALSFFAYMRAHEHCIRVTDTISAQINRQRKLEPALDYIRAHYHETCGEALLASLCGLERVYFSKLFKKTTGITVHAYIDRLRLGMAQQLLTASDKTTAIIAEEVGFKNESYFYRWFRLKTGCTPHEYRTRFY